MSTETRHYAQDEQVMSYQCFGDAEAQFQLVWAHGWGQDRNALQPLAESWRTSGQNLLIDFPGFGASPRPAKDWGTADYADYCAAFLNTLPAARRLWIGHSFGCRVGLQLAAQHPTLVDALCLIAAAGLPRRRSITSRLKVKSKVALYKTLRALPIGDKDRLRERFGSADYRAAGEMRGILTKIVNEDLSDVAKAIECPVKLIYGSADEETPPEIGRRLAQLIPAAVFVELDGLDHYSVLDRGRHQIAFQLKRFVEAMEDEA